MKTEIKTDRKTEIKTEIIYIKSICKSNTLRDDK